MMYQTVGHEGIFLYAEAMAVPIFTATTQGRAECTSMQYEVKEQDEVEDLYQLLKKVKVSQETYQHTLNCETQSTLATT